LAGIIKRAQAQWPHLSGMEWKPGHRDSATAPRVTPSLKSLYAEAHILRDTVLRRLVATGYEIDEGSLLEAQAIITDQIGELVATPEYETLLDRPGGENRILTLLVHSCAAKLDPMMQRAHNRHDKAAFCGTPCSRPLRLVAENGKLLEN
jgi:hypothetical protein